MENIIAKIENFNNKLNAMFNGSEKLPHGYDLTVEEVEEFKNSFTQVEIQKLNYLYFELWYRTEWKQYTISDLLELLEFKRELKEVYVEKSLNLGGDEFTIMSYDGIRKVNFAYILEQLKKYAHLYHELIEA